MELGIQTDKDNALDALEITPQDMREFLTAYHNRVTKGQTEAQIIIWVNERMMKDIKFRKCVLACVGLGAGMAHSKINNATDHFMDSIKKGD